MRKLMSKVHRKRRRVRKQKFHEKELQEEEYRSQIQDMAEAEQAEANAVAPTGAAGSALGAVMESKYSSSDDDLTRDEDESDESDDATSSTNSEVSGVVLGGPLSKNSESKPQSIPNPYPTNSTHVSSSLREC